MTVTTSNFNELLEKSSQTPLLLDFWAPWCGPCRMLTPVIEQLESETKGSIIVGKVNVDEQTELAEKFSIVSIPTLIVIKDKKIVSKSLGYKSLSQIKDMLGID